MAEPLGRARSRAHGIEEALKGAAGPGGSVARICGVLASIPGCLYLSHPQAIARAEYKPVQLAAACQAEGVPCAGCLHRSTCSVDGEPDLDHAATVQALDDPRVQPRKACVPERILTPLPAPRPERGLVR